MPSCLPKYAGSSCAIQSWIKRRRCTSPPIFGSLMSNLKTRMRWTEIRGNPVAIDGVRARLVSVRDTTESRTREEARIRADNLDSPICTQNVV